MKPDYETFQKCLKFTGVPDVEDVHYDLWTLRVTLRFEKKKGPVYVDFESTRSFRVMDEGDLLEFWKKEERPLGSIWRIHRNGWHDLESSRSGYLASSNQSLEEYLIVGMNECVNVISYDAPKLIEP
jgi:hypothetical protein